MARLKRAQVAPMGYHYVYYPLDFMLDAQQNAGYKTIELLAMAPHYLVDYASYQDPLTVRHMVEDRGMKVGCITPEGTGYHFTICGADESYRRRSLGYFRNAIEAGAKMGADRMFVRCGGGPFDDDPQKIYERAVKSLKELAPVAEDNGVTIAVATMRSVDSRIVNTLPQLQRLLTDVDSKSVKAALDTCSMGVAGETPRQWFQTLGKDIAHIHFSDGRPNGHLVWGDGLYPLEDYIDALNEYGYEGILGLELTDYFDHPDEADARNFAALKKYFVD